MMVKRVRAVVDRIVDQRQAVLLLEEHKREVILPLEGLAEDLREGLWLHLEMDEEDRIIHVEVDQALTEAKASHVKQLMKQLKKRKGSSYKL